MFLPLSNARLLKVSRSSQSRNRDYYASAPAAASGVLWEGDADALISQRVVRDRTATSIEYFTETKLALPAVTELQPDDVVTVVLRGKPARDYKLEQVAEDTTDLHPVDVYQCIAERE